MSCWVQHYISSVSNAPAVLEIVDESPGMLDENLVGVVVRLFISV